MTWFALATADVDGQPTAALRLDDGTLVAPPELAGTSVRQLLDEWATTFPQLSALANGSVREYALPADVELLTPVRYPDALLAVGANYRDHLEEMGLAVERWTPMPFFHRPPRTSLVGPGETVRIPRSTQQFDWECELAVVLGAPLRHATPEQARAAVAGYAIGLDLSCRDLTVNDSDIPVDLPRGKAQDTLAPCGPVVVPAAFVPDDADLRIELSVDGEPMMDSSTRQMLWTVDELLAEISEYCTLTPGDIVFTGSPGGSAHNHGDRWLQPGDRIDATITGIPTLTVTMRKDD
jgi:2,4-didehydro-3-deoxy-L-rhamnonate hydrolase